MEEGIQDIVKLHKLLESLDLVDVFKTIYNNSNIPEIVKVSIISNMIAEKKIELGHQDKWKK